MHHAEVIRFLLQMAVLLGGAVCFGQGAKRIGLPPVVGELLAGIVLGKTVFGSVAPQLFTHLFPISGEAAIARDAVSRVGLLLFLFIAGSEVELSHFRKQTRRVLWTSLCGMVVPFALGVASVRCFPELWQSAVGDGSRFELLVGTAMAISALPVIARILKEQNLLGTEIGFLVLTAATVDDLVGWTLFGILLAPRSNIGLVVLQMVCAVSGIIGIGRFIGRPIIERLQKRHSEPAVLLGIVAIFVFAASAVTESIGVHAVVGAFLMGVALKPGTADPEAKSVPDLLSAPLLGVLTPLYFVSVCLKTNIVAHFAPGLIVLVTGIACFGKIIGGGFGAWCGGLPFRRALAVGCGMNARGAMEIILASVALEHGLINERIFVALVFMAIFTSLLSAPLMRWLLSSPAETAV